MKNLIIIKKTRKTIYIVSKKEFVVNLICQNNESGNPSLHITLQSLFPEYSECNHAIISNNDYAA